MYIVQLLSLLNERRLNLVTSFPAFIHSLLSALVLPRLD